MKKVSKKKFKLPKKFRKEWLKALRSGNYEQGTELLLNRETDSYCCLGVACKVLGINEFFLDGIELPNELHLESQIIPDLILGDSGRLINAETKDWFVEILTSMNDGNICKRVKEKAPFLERRQYNFDEIADFIEVNTKGI